MASLLPNFQKFDTKVFCFVIVNTTLLVNCNFKLTLLKSRRHTNEKTFAKISEILF